MYTFYVFLWATVTGSIFILFVHFLLKDTSFLLRSGLGFFAVTILLCILRLFTPLEFPSFQHRIEYPDFFSELIRPRYLFQTRIPLVYALGACSLGVSLVLLLRFLYKTGKISRTLETHSQEDPEAEETLRSIDEDCGIQVRRSALLKGPVLAGYRHPVIYLPRMPLSKNNLIDILRHEYTHWKRHHLALKFLIQLIIILFWWNPCVYVLSRDLSHIIEMICDEYAMDHYGKMEKFHYMDTLLHCLRHSAGIKEETEPRICALGFAAAASGSSTRQRLTYHMSKTEARSGRNPGVYLLYAAALCWMAVSYYVILQPSYDPPGKENYSNEDNSYLVECPDGSYEFYYEDYVIPVSAGEVDSGGYLVYTIIPYSEYKDLGDYKESPTYKKWIADKGK